MNLGQLNKLIANGESSILEWKKSTGQLTRAGESLSAFLNGAGGTVLFGIAPDGAISGQLISDGTLRDVAQMLQRMDPPAPARMERIALPGTSRNSLKYEVSAPHFVP